MNCTVLLEEITYSVRTCPDVKNTCVLAVPLAPVTIVSTQVELKKILIVTPTAPVAEVVFPTKNIILRLTLTSEGVEVETKVEVLVTVDILVVVVVVVLTLVAVVVTVLA